MFRRYTYTAPSIPDMPQYSGLHIDEIFVDHSRSKGRVWNVHYKDKPIDPTQRAWWAEKIKVPA